MSYQDLEYNVDLVFCIDVTRSMVDLLETVKSNVLSFYRDLQKAFNEKGKNVDSLRIKVIAFRDFEADGNDSIEQLEFVKLPDEEDKFHSFISGLRPKGGGDEPENGLEALALAIKSDWRWRSRQHIIVVFSDASTHPLEKSSNYKPSGMPADFNELTDWWEGQTYMSPTAKRLVLFTPDVAAWTDIATYWAQVIHYPSKAGKGLGDIDYLTIISAIVNDI